MWMAGMGGGVGWQNVRVPEDDGGGEQAALGGGEIQKLREMMKMLMKVVMTEKAKEAKLQYRRKGMRK